MCKNTRVLLDLEIYTKAMLNLHQGSVALDVKFYAKAMLSSMQRFRVHAMFDLDQGRRANDWVCEGKR